MLIPVTLEEVESNPDGVLYFSTYSDPQKYDVAWVIKDKISYLVRPEHCTQSATQIFGDRLFGGEKKTWLPGKGFYYFNQEEVDKFASLAGKVVPFSGLCEQAKNEIGISLILYPFTTRSKSILKLTLI